MFLPTNLTEGIIRRGSILHSTDFKDIDHGKFFVVVGMSDDYIAGFFFINSRVHPSIMNKPEQICLQYPLKAEDYSFLKYDSFLSASSIIKKPRVDIIHSIQDGKTVYVDELKQADLNNVLEMVRDSKIYSKKDKERFFY